MKSFVCEVSIHNTFQQAEVEPVNIEYRKWAGRIEPSYDLKLVTLTDMPACCFKDEVVEEVLSQARHDHWLIGDIEEHLAVDSYGNQVDVAYEWEQERKILGV